MSTACRIKAPGKPKTKGIPLREVSHPPLKIRTVHFDPDVNDLRLAMAVDSVRFRQCAQPDTVTLMNLDYGVHAVGDDALPESNTRETFAQLALELGFRERSSIAGPDFELMGTMAAEEV